MTDSGSRVLDLLMAVWSLAAGLVFVGPLLVAVLSREHVRILLDGLVELEAPGRYVYIMVAGACLVGAALRLVRRYSGSDRTSGK